MSASSLFPDLPASPTGGAGSSSLGATQSLYRKYRPQTFDSVDLVGQDSIVRTLRNAIRLDRVAHAYLFTGPRGTGKTTTARLLAKAVNCLDPDPDARPCNTCAACIAINNGSTTDVIEIDAASNRGIDDIRELRERVKFAPTFLKTKFYIVDEAHQITGAAANAFLKTLEEPPAHTKFILATTDPEQLLQTIVSRCQRFDFKRISREAAISRLTTVADSEGIAIEPDALIVVGEHAGGSLRDALGLLDQLASYRQQTPDGNQLPISADDVRELLGIARSERVVQLMHALADSDAGRGLDIINSAFEAGEDPRQINRQLVALLRVVMFQVASGARGTDEDVVSLAEKFSLGEIARHSARFSEIDYRIRHATLPQLPLEIAFVQATLDTDVAVRGERTASREAPRPIERDREQRPSVPQPSRERVDPPPSLAAEPTRNPEQSKPAERELVRSIQEQRPSSPPPSSSQPSAIDRPSPPISVPVGGSISVDLLHDLWPKIRLDIKARDRRIEALLSSCDPASVNGSAITLVTSYKFHLEKMNEDASRELIESVIGRLVNQSVSVTTEIRGANGTAPSGSVRDVQRSADPASIPAVETPKTVERSLEEQTVIDAAKHLFDAEEITPRS